MKLLNVEYQNLTVRQALDQIFQLISEGKKANLFFLNADCLFKAQKDDEYRAILQNADLVLPDGIGLKLASRVFGEKMKEDCNGTDLSPQLLEEAAQRNLRIFFLGGKEGVASKAAENIQRKFPGIKVVGAESGYFRDDQKMVEKINQVRPDILFVAMGVPLQEKWISKHRQILDVKLCLGVGALLDYLSGSIPRAPKWMRKFHLEWFWRILIDPRRMFKRYVIDGFGFVMYVIYRRLRAAVLSSLVAALLLVAFSPHIFAEDFHWEFAGWYGGGCYPNVAFDPNVKDRVYLTSDVAGLWRSDDLGEHWYFITKGLEHLMVAQVAVAPSDSNILYAATGGGVFVSKDAGASWSATNTADKQITFVRPASYRAIAVHPQHSQQLCIGSAKGRVFCSKDSGSSWQNLDPMEKIFKDTKPIPALSFDHEGKNLYVASSNGLNRCGRERNTCQAIKESPIQITDFALSQKTTGTFYVAGQEGLWISRDAAASWIPSQAVPQGATYRVALDESGESPVIRVIWNQDWNGGVFLSRDDGKTWEAQDQLNADMVSNPSRIWKNNGGKSTSLQIDPFQPDILFRTDWWGVWRSDDGGATWNEKIIGAPNNVTTSLAFAPNGDMLVASMDNGLMRSRDGGKSYEALFPKKYDPATSGHIWRVDVAGDAIIVTSSPWDQKVNQVIMTRDEGQNFDMVRQGLPEKRPRENTMWGEGYARALAVDPNDPDTIYLGIDGDDGGGLFISNDRGKTWKRSDGQPGASRIYNGLAVDPTDSNRIAWGAGGKNGGVHISEDRGKTFRHVFKKMPWVFGLTFTSEGALYAAGDQDGAKLYASHDHDQNWKMIGDFQKK
ncbi:MAG: WecB/TagA/CpsF family glycosyltransferase, partial [Candidatus Omnitrophica bacterium]|nr:WecB/TagA/CpsF family glycosyltransferase [Candidatus Omnitrophota bacterium]